jgi:hypothetical protein
MKKTKMIDQSGITPYAVILLSLHESRENRLRIGETVKNIHDNLMDYIKSNNQVISCASNNSVNDGLVFEQKTE